jgi:NTE family protein
MTPQQEALRSNDPNAPKVGLVLSGGGARGAYEIGVLRYVRERLHIPTRFSVITGTSVGAINGGYIAATCDRPRAQARILARVWSELNIDSVYQFGWSQFRNLPNFLFARELPNLGHGGRVGGLVDGSYLESIVRTRIPWDRIGENIRAGNLDAYACTATELATGICTTFMQRHPDAPPLGWRPGVSEAVIDTEIHSAHALASAAIPGLFPAVRVGDQFFVDGMLRQNTPLRPAIRLGANRILSVALDHPPTKEQALLRSRDRARETFPNAFFLLGKTLNALLLDKLGADLAQIRRVNEWLEAGIKAFGPDFAEKMAQHTESSKVFRSIKTVVIHPSVDLGVIAWDVIRRTGLRAYSGLVARMIRRSMEESRNFGAGENDFASYVLFEPNYINEIIELGFQDAKQHRDEIEALFMPEGAQS